MSRTLLAPACLLLLAIAGCSGSGAPRSRTDQATFDACRSYASRVYDRQNRATIYSINRAGTGVPFSDNYVPGNQTSVLADRFQNANRIDDCIRNTGTTVNRNNPASVTPIPR